jgi:hypothetical protein
VWSDGVRTRTEGVDEKGNRSGSYTDEAKGLRWIYGPSFGCIQMPIKPPAEMKSATKQEAQGEETIGGHPARKYRITSTGVIKGKEITDISYVWKATDLGDLVLRRVSASWKFEMNLAGLVIGKPAPAQLAMPPGCKYDEMQDATRNEPSAAGGDRTIRFSDASCKKLIPLPLELSIPADYAIRGSRLGCFWGTAADLDRVLATDTEADFTKIVRGVFWCRVSDSTEYNPQRSDSRMRRGRTIAGSRR